MTVDGSPDEPGATWATSSSPTILWRPVVGRDLFEARIPARSGRSPGWYAGYVARTPGDGDDEWRGYIGLTHVPIGVRRCKRSWSGACGSCWPPVPLAGAMRA